MPKYVIERNILTLALCQQKSCRLFHRSRAACSTAWGRKSSGYKVVTGDKVYRIYIAPDQQTLREHGHRGGFSVERISEVIKVIDPTTAEMHAALTD